MEDDIIDPEQVDPFGDKLFAEAFGLDDVIEFDDDVDEVEEDGYDDVDSL